MWLLMALVAAVALALGHLRRPYPIATAAYPAHAGSPTSRWEVCIVEGAAISAPSINPVVRDGTIIELGGATPLPGEVDRPVKLLAGAVPPDAASAKE